MTPEVRLMKMESDFARLKATVAVFASVAAIWLAGTTALAMFALMPRKEPPPSVEEAVAAKSLVADTGVVRLLRVERLEVGSAGDGSAAAAKPLLIADKTDEGMALVMAAPDGTSHIVIAAGENRATAMFQSGDRFTDVANDSISLYTRRPSAANDMVVSIGSGELGGGTVDVYNPLGKRVASMQADKRNSGMVLVGDLTGEPKRTLAAP